MKQGAHAHEDLRRDEIALGSDRAFGFVFSGFFAVLAGLGVLRGSERAPLWWAAAAVTVLVVALAVPRVLHPFNRLWHAFGMLLGRFTTPAVMGLVFYVAVTPTGLIMRALGRDPLRLRYDAAARSYWIDRVPAGPPPASMKNPF